MALHYVPIDRWTYFNDRQVFDISFRPDLKLLEPHLKPAHFKQHDILFQADEEIRHVYSPPARSYLWSVCRVAR